MDYQTEVTAILALAALVGATTKRLDYQLHNTVADHLQQRTKTWLDGLKAQNEALAHSPVDHLQGLFSDRLKKNTAAAHLTASVALRRAQLPWRELTARYPTLIARARVDASLSFPDALAGIGPNGMLTFYLLRETVRPSVDNADPAALLARYTHAIDMRDQPIGLIEAELIEARIATGAGLASAAEHLTVLRELRLAIAETQELRVPFTVEETGSIEFAIETARKTISRADIVRISPIDDTHPANHAAAEAFAAESPIYAAAIAAAGAAA